MSVHLIIGQKENLITSAVVSALATRTTSAYRKDSVSRVGNGTIGLSGDSNVTEDTAIDIKIASDPGGTPRVSDPIFAGIGTSEISELLAQPGAGIANYSVRLADVGTREAYAEVNLDGYVLRSKNPGDAGNDFYIDIASENLVRTQTDYSLIASLDANTNNATGEEWDYETVVGSGNIVPDNAKRISVGDDLSVYRQWKAFENREWVYKFYPEIAKTHPAGDRISFVTGKYSVKITNNTTTETYDAVTIRELLVDIDANSQIVDVVSIPEQELTIDNEAAYADISIRTDARVNYTDGSGSSYATGFIDYYLGNNTFTEIVEATCYANQSSHGSGIGQEIWSVTGSVSGKLNDAVTGVPFTGNGFSFTIPTRLPDGWDEPRGEITFDVNTTSREAGDNTPNICMGDLRVGPNASNKTITFTYTKRPTDCDCENVQYERLPSAEDCLNIDIAEENYMGILVASHASRLQLAARYYREFTEGNTEMSSTGDLKTSAYDIDLAKKAYSLAIDSLGRIFNEGVYDFDSWQASTAIAIDDAIKDGEKKFVCSVPGTTGAVAPDFSTATAIGDTVTDNEVTWRYDSKTPLSEWDDFLEEIKTDLTVIETIGALTSVPGWEYDTSYVTDDVARGYQLRKWGSSSGFPGVEVEYTHSSIFRCIVGGTTGPKPDPTNDEYNYYNYPFIYSGTGQEGKDTSNQAMTWVYIGQGYITSDADITSQPDGSSGFAFDIDAYMNRYKSAYDHVLSTAEIIPNINDASTTGQDPGSSCWRDPGDSFYWSSKDYLPMFTNKEYVSVRRKSDGSGDIVSTGEFAGVIKVDCMEFLSEGDSITISISNAAQPATYQIGDKLRLSMTAAAPLFMQGGIDGTNILEWNVISENGNGTYLVDIDNPAAYDDGNVSFKIIEGGVDSQINDEYTFCVEDGSFAWRKNGGGWSGNLPIQDTEITDGITVTFTNGQCPNFVADDETNFTVIQQNSVENVKNSLEPSYRWPGTDASISAVISGAVSAVMIAMHTLPETCIITVTDGASINEVIPWSEGPIVYDFDQVLTDPTITITITGAEGAKIGWLWAGSPFSIYPLAETQTRFERFYMNEGINYGLMNAVGSGSLFGWNGFISKDELIRLRGIIRQAKTDYNSPLCIVGNKYEMDQAMLAKPPDEIRWNDFSEFHDPNPNGGLDHQNINLRMEFTPWRI